MSTPLDPRISEFETQEQADSYDRWFRERIQRSLDDPRPNIPHDEVMAKMKTIIENAKQRQKRQV
ncbi:stability determinant [Halomonas elongata]|uniref:type II toxin-antitoxin system RelB family antitoxin n=1 Tax=Halomonas elongata TaxID=2746 RepID=UPI0038D4935F